MALALATNTTPNGRGWANEEAEVIATAIDLLEEREKGRG